MTAVILTPNIVAIERKLSERMRLWAPQLAAVELCYGVDPFTVAAIIERESDGGEALTPRGPAGRAAHGFGLGGLDQERHTSFLLAQFEDGRPLWADPTMHVLYVGRVIRRYLDLLDGDYPATIAAYDCGIARAKGVISRRSVDRGSINDRILALDEVTTGGNYVSDVLARRANFIGATLGPGR